MIAKIEIYNDSGDLVSKCEAPPCKKLISYYNDYEVRNYDFRFRYSECIPKWINLSKGGEE